MSWFYCGRGPVLWEVITKNYLSHFLLTTETEFEGRKLPEPKGNTSYPCLMIKNLFLILFSEYSSLRKSP